MSKSIVLNIEGITVRIFALSFYNINYSKSETNDQNYDVLQIDFEFDSDNYDFQRCEYIKRQLKRVKGDNRYKLWEYNLQGKTKRLRFNKYKVDIQVINC